MIFAEPDVEAVAAQVGDVASQNGGLRMQGVAEEDPAGVCPPAAFARRVRIAFLVAQLVVHAMSGHPEDRPALKRESGADGHQVLDPLGRLVAAVRQQAVVAHADADVDGQYMKHGHDCQPLPGEEKERGQRAQVEQSDGDQREPVEAFAHSGSLAHVDLLAGGYGGRLRAGLRDGFVN